MSRGVPFQLLELNVISAQDLSPVSKKSQTYAIIWISPERKLRTRTDQKGRTNPTWNDKFVFRVDDEFLDSNESTVNIELYASGWIKDIPVGSVEVSIANLIPQSIRTTMASSSRIVALQIRRPSGRPQGILNMGVTLLDNTMRSMPLYTEVRTSDLNSQELRDSKMFKQQAHRKCKEPKLGEESKEIEAKKIQIERSQSDVSDLTTKEITPLNMNASLACNLPGTMPNNGQYGSSINGSVFEVGGNGSMCNSDIGPSPSVVAVAVARGLILTPIGVPRNAGSSILADWKTEQTSMEGLKTKIERWRTEYPSINGHQNNNSHKTENSMRKSSSTTNLRRSKTDGGLFRCFGNAYGFEISIVCGGGNNNNSRRSKGRLMNRSCESASSMLTKSA